MEVKSTTAALMTRSVRAVLRNLTAACVPDYPSQGRFRLDERVFVPPEPENEPNLGGHLPLSASRRANTAAYRLRANAVILC